MKSNTLILKGNIVFSVSPYEIKYYPDSYIVVENGASVEIIRELPHDISDFRVLDYGDRLIIPGFSDLHIHAPQFYQRGIGMDSELLEWLSKYTFQHEKAFSDREHAKKVYNHFTDELVNNGTLHASIFATIHEEATRILFKTLIDKGITAYVGKVNMDRNSIPELTEETESSIRVTEELIRDYGDHPFVKPILTPRFAPACSPALLKRLGDIAAKYNIPVQSHLSESQSEVEWVKKLYPNHKSYSDVYDYYGLFGQTKTLMAHCIYLCEEEIDLICKKGVIAVHCPDSNFNLTSGIMPSEKLIKKGVNLGLGTDVGGGHNISMTKTIVSSIQSSRTFKMKDPEIDTLKFEEAFYMATKGNGRFFGKVGSFEPGYDFDALIIDDTSLGCREFDLSGRLQRFIYIGDDRNIIHKFVKGNLIA